MDCLVTFSLAQQVSNTQSHDSACTQTSAEVDNESRVADSSVDSKLNINNGVQAPFRSSASVLKSCVKSKGTVSTAHPDLVLLESQDEVSNKS